MPSFRSYVRYVDITIAELRVRWSRAEQEVELLRSRKRLWMREELLSHHKVELIDIIHKKLNYKQSNEARWVKEVGLRRLRF